MQPMKFLSRTCSASRGKVIGVGVHIYVGIYVCGPKKIESYSIDSTFQTFAVELLVEFID